MGGHAWSPTQSASSGVEEMSDGEADQSRPKADGHQLVPLRHHEPTCVSAE